MNANRMWTSVSEFAQDIIWRYDHRCLWISPEAERRFALSLPRALENLLARAGLGRGFEEDFFAALAQFVVQSLLPNLRDDDQGFTYKVVEDVLARAAFKKLPDAPPIEKVEFWFYQKARSVDPVPALAAFFSEHWCCARVWATLSASARLCN